MVSLKDILPAEILEQLITLKELLEAKEPKAASYIEVDLERNDK